MGITTTQNFTGNSISASEKNNIVNIGVNNIVTDSAEMTVNASTLYPAGTLLALDPATNTFVPARSDAKNFPIAVLYTEIPATNTLTTKKVRIITSGTVNSQALVFNKTGDTLATVSSQAELNWQYALKDFGIDVATVNEY